ncbi:MAG: hypothetical protein ACP5N1_06340 [Candidatus Woesearchaeota archaeon]
MIYKKDITKREYLSKSIIFLAIVLVLFFLSAPLAHSAYNDSTIDFSVSKNIILSIDSQSLNQSNTFTEQNLILHLSNSLNSVYATDSLLVNDSNVLNISPEYVNVSLDYVDFSSIYELSVYKYVDLDQYTLLSQENITNQNTTNNIQANVYKYFGKLQFPLQYNITDYGFYVFRLSKMYDDSIVSESSFSYYPSYLGYNDDILDLITHDNSTYMYNLTSNDTYLSPLSQLNSSNNTNTTQNTNNTEINIIQNNSLNQGINLSENSSLLYNDSRITLLDKCRNIFISLEKETYFIGESVQILFSNIYGKDVSADLIIITDTTTYKFIGDLKDVVFIPQMEGNYSILLRCDSIVVYSQNFSVVSEKSVVESTHNDVIDNSYNDLVINDSRNLSTLTNNSNTSDVKNNFVIKRLSLKNSKGEAIVKNVKAYNVLKLNDSIVFNEAIIGNVTGDVANITNVNKINNINTIDDAIKKDKGITLLPKLTNEVTNLEKISNYSENYSENDSLNYSENNNSLSNLSIHSNLSALFNLSDSSNLSSFNDSNEYLSNATDNSTGSANITNSTALNDSNTVYSDSSLELIGLVDIDLSDVEGLNTLNIELTNLVIDSNEDLDIYIEDVPRNKIVFDGNVVDSYAMDLSNLNFTNGTFTKTAIGKELWKCVEWDFNNQNCVGSWIKVMDILPGTDYDLIVSPIDPGYIETGVATVNTLKSLYYPNDDVDIVMVILDTRGYLVSEAMVTLTIISPNNNITTASTNDYITSSHKGIYEVGFDGTSLEGEYTLIVEAMGENVNQTMISHFVVNNTHLFEILKSAPVTIDPINGPYSTNITIISNFIMTNFNYTEVLPLSFDVIDAGGAIESIVDNKKHLTWYNLTNNSLIQYFVTTPSETPNVFEIGPGFIDYMNIYSSNYNSNYENNLTNSTITNSTSDNTTIDSLIINPINQNTYYVSSKFYESRSWFLAIDPLFTGTFFMLWDGSSSAPTGWTCVSCNPGELFYQKFILGGINFGTTGGNATHNHTVDYVSNTNGATYIGTSTLGANGANRASDTHTHSDINAATTSLASNYPMFRQLKVIAYSGRVPSIITAGAIGLFNTTSLPTNWTQYNAQNDYFIFANATANITGGSNNHTHNATIVTSASTGISLQRTGGSQVNVANAPHTHTGFGNVSLGNNIPPYIDIVLAKTTSAVPVPYGQGFIGMFNVL